MNKITKKEKALLAEIETLKNELDLYYSIKPKNTPETVLSNNLKTTKQCKLYLSLYKSVVATKFGVYISDDDINCNIKLSHLEAECLGGILSRWFKEI